MDLVAQCVWEVAVVGEPQHCRVAPMNREFRRWAYRRMGFYVNNPKGRRAITTAEMVSLIVPILLVFALFVMKP